MSHLSTTLPAPASPAERRMAAFLSRHGPALRHTLEAAAGAEGSRVADRLERAAPTGSVAAPDAPALRRALAEAVDLLAAVPIQNPPGGEGGDAPANLGGAVCYFGARLSDLLPACPRG